MKLKEHLYKRPCKFTSLSPSSAETYDVLCIHTQVVISEFTWYYGSQDLLSCGKFSTQQGTNSVYAELYTDRGRQEKNQLKR